MHCKSAWIPLFQVAHDVILNWRIRYLYKVAFVHYTLNEYLMKKKLMLSTIFLAFPTISPITQSDWVCSCEEKANRNQKITIISHCFYAQEERYVVIKLSVCPSICSDHKSRSSHWYQLLLVKLHRIFKQHMENCYLGYYGPEFKRSRSSSALAPAPSNFWGHIQWQGSLNIIWYDRKW